MNLTICGENSAGCALESGKSFDVDAFAARYGGVTVSRLPAGSLLYRQGEPSDALYYVQEGQLQVTVVSSQGKEAVLNLVGVGQFCDEGCLLANRNRVATAACMVESLVARLECTSVAHAIRDNPEFAEFFLVYALKNMSRLRDSLISQLFDFSEARLARALLLLANYGNPQGGASVIRNVDQETLAQMIGTTRSRVNHFMNKFRKLHHIDYDGNAILVFRSLSGIALGENAQDVPEMEDVTA